MTTPQTATLNALLEYYKPNVAKTRVIKDIVAYMTSRGEENVFQNIPVVACRPFDLYLLYETVLKRGGSQLVSSDHLWQDILDTSFPSAKITSFGLSEIYRIYLSSYEKKQLYGIDDCTSLKSCLPLNTPRDRDGMYSNVIYSAKSVRRSEIPENPKRKKLKEINQAQDMFQKIALSLDSTIPANIDHAINTLTVLSFGSEEEFVLSNSSCLLDALLRFLKSCSIDLLPMKSFYNKKYSSQQQQEEEEEEEERQKQQQKAESLFPIKSGQHSTLDTKDEPTLVMTERILMILNILCNASFVEDNKLILVEHKEWMNTFILLLYARNKEILEYAIEILANLSNTIILPDTPINDDHIQQNQLNQKNQQHHQVYLNFIPRLMELVSSTFRMEALKSCECLANLAKKQENQHLFQINDSMIYTRLVELLTISNHGVDALTKLGNYTHGNMPNHSTNEQNHSTNEQNHSTNEQTFQRLSCNTTFEFGVVFGPRNTPSSYWPQDDDLDYQVRDAALQLLDVFSSLNNDIKLKIAAEPHCLQTLCAVLNSKMSKAGSAHTVAGILENIAVYEKTFKYFVAIEKDLVLIALSDATLYEMLSKVLHTVYGVASAWSYTE